MNELNFLKKTERLKELDFLIKEQMKERDQLLIEVDNINRNDYKQFSIEPEKKFLKKINY